ncbi:MAG TPA: hypothetical protein VJU85_06075, partial [Nitrososphaeraceae archaeon]|nr:hypothetical protein [Nitrososphaeraceae archaeon]
TKELFNPDTGKFERQVIQQKDVSRRDFVYTLYKKTILPNKSAYRRGIVANYIHSIDAALM